MENVKRTEAIAAANPNKGNRVTLDQVLGSIAETHYFHPGDAFPDPNAFDRHHVMWTMTICVCVLKNGWAIVGKSAPADPKMFDAEIGQKLAHEDCIRQIWPLLGFLLRQTIWENFEAGPSDGMTTDPSASQYGPVPGEKM